MDPRSVGVNPDYSNASLPELKEMLRASGIPEDRAAIQREIKKRDRPGEYKFTPPMRLGGPTPDDSAPPMGRLSVDPQRMLDATKAGGHALSGVFDTIKRFMDHGYSPGTQDEEGVRNAAKVGGMTIGAGSPAGAGMRNAVGAAGARLGIGNRAGTSAAPTAQEVQEFYQVFDKNNMSAARTANELGITSSAVNRRLELPAWKRPAVADAEAETAQGGPKSLGEIIRERPSPVHEVISQPSIEKMIIDEHRLGSTPASIAAKVRRAVGMNNSNGLSAEAIKGKISELLTSKKYGR